MTRPGKTERDKKWSSRVGLEIAIRREDAGLTQRAVAEKVGICVETVRSYESGKAEPRSHSLYLLARALGCSMEDFYMVISEQEASEEGRHAPGIAAGCIEVPAPAV